MLNSAGFNRTEFTFIGNFNFMGAFNLKLLYKIQFFILASWEPGTNPADA